MSIFLQDSYLLDEYGIQIQKLQDKDQFISNLFFKDPIFLKKGIIITSNSQIYQAIKEFQFQKKVFFIKIKVYKQTSYISLFVTEIENNQFKKIPSRHLEILLMKVLSRNVYDIISTMSTFYIHNGYICLKIFANIPQSKSNQIKNLIDQHTIFIKAILKFVQISNYNYKQITQTHLTLQNKRQLQEYFYTNQLMMHKTGQFLNTQNPKYLYYQEIKEFKDKFIEQVIIQRDISFLFINIQKTSQDCINFIANIQQHITTYHKIIPSQDHIEQESRSITSRLSNQIQILSLQNINKCIGNGSLSVVYLAKMTFNYVSSQDYTPYPYCKLNNKKIVAVKSLKLEAMKRGQQKLNNEKKILQKMKNSCSKYFLKYYQTNNQNYKNSLIMSFRSPETLDEYVERNILSLSLLSKIILLHNIVSGIKNLIDYQIVHLDLKPQNILVCESFITKIIDFGESYHKQLSKEDYIPGFTFPYVAPQVFKSYYIKQKRKKIPSLIYSEAQDVYAFGIIMSQVLFNNQIFYLSEEQFKKVYIKNLLNNRIMLCVQDLLDYGSTLIMTSLFHIMIRCLEQSPQQRPKFDWIRHTLKIIIKHLT